MALAYELINSNENLNLSSSDKEKILQMASWEVEPRFPQPGRSAWISLDNPITWKNTKLASAKLKGVGIYNPKTKGYSGVHNEEFFDVPRPPSDREYPYTAKALHVGFDNRGKFIMIQGEPAPFGGILLDRANNEFIRLKDLSEKSGMANVPAFSGKYSNITFQGKPLGFCVSLYSAEYPNRLNQVLSDNNHTSTQVEFSNQVRKTLGFSYKDFKEEDYCYFASEIFKRVGISLRKFSLAGLFRYSGGLDNFLFCLDTGDALMTDVDSSLKLSGLPEEIRPLQVLRDFASVVFKLYIRIGHPHYIQNFPISHLVDNDPLGGLLDGYFPQVDKSKKNIAEENISRYHIEGLKQVHEQSMDVRDVIDRKLSYVISILAAYELYKSSSLNNYYPLNFEYEQLWQNALTFLGQSNIESIEYLR